MGITTEIEALTNTWTKEIAKANDWLADSTSEELIRFLNDQRNICTPGFLLRRQLQIKFPEIVKIAAKNSSVEEFADLTTVGNVQWSDTLIDSLSKILIRTTFNKYGNTSLEIESKHWNKYLTDQAHCNRNTAIKLIFALEMDDAVASKFLISNGNDLLSLRNPFDYSCKACLTCGLTYFDAVDLFQEFDFQRQATNDSAIQNVALNAVTNYSFTEIMKNETTLVAQFDKMSSDEIKNYLLRLMLEHKSDFTYRVYKKNQSHKDKAERDTKYSAGYSLQNIRRMQLFLRYLMLLYPTFYTFDKFRGSDLLVTRKVAQYDNGLPKIKQLLTAIFDKHEIDLPEYSELEDFFGPKIPARGVVKRIYDNIPFNKHVIIPLKGLSKTLRSILRAVEYPENARDLNRDTILLLTYFFITGLVYASDTIISNFKETLIADKKKFGVRDAESSLLIAFEEVSRVVKSIKRETKNLPHIYITALNKILVRFNFNEFYAPFVLDRFILLSLLSINDEQDDFVQLFMQTIIEKSYQMSNEIMAT